MTRRRWIADQVSGSSAILTGSHAQHLSRVLRAKIGQEFDVAVNGELRRGRIVHIDDSRVEFELGDPVPAVAALHVTLALSIFKFDRMEWAIEKCTELGVTRIIPVIADRTDKHLAAASTKRADRWRRLATQASEQSRRLAAPDISPPTNLKELLSIPAAHRIVLSEIEQDTTLMDALTAVQSTQALALAIGPEGGWTENELKLFSEAGWTPASLGGTILRVETAAIAALAIVQSELN
jgi:16S rRNA (uracil1498-N3)-methyltransferase